MDKKFVSVYEAKRASGQSDADILTHAEESQRYGALIKQSRDMGMSDGAILSGLKAGTLSVMANPEREIPTNLERAGRGVADYAEGISQIARGAANKVSPGSGGDVTEYTKQRDRENAAYEQGRSQGAGAGFDWVRHGYKALMAAPLFELGGLQGAALLPRVGMNAAAGGGLAGLEYVPAGGSRARNMAIGALFAGGLSGAFGGRAQTAVRPNPVTGADETITIPAGNGINLIRSLVQPATQRGREGIVGGVLTQAAGGQGMADDAANALRTGASDVPGVAPTAAEAANNQGISGLQGVVSAQNKAQFAARRMDNNAARLAYLRANGTIAEADDVARATAARAAASEGAFDTARNVTVAPDAELSGLLNRPAVEAALPEVNNILRNQDLPPVDLTNPTTGQLHLIAQQIRQASSGGAANAAGVTRLAGGAAGDVGTGITGWLERNVPEFQQGMEAFRAGSVPVNQAQVGEEIGRRILANQLLDEAGNFTIHPSRVGAVTNRLDDIASNVTGMPRRAADVMSPGQINALNTVGADLQRLQFADEGAKAIGSNTYQNLAYDNMVDSAGIPMLSRIPGLQKLAGMLYSGTDEDMRAMLANALLNPQRAAELIDVSAGRADPTVAQAIGRALIAPASTSTAQQGGALLLRNAQGR